MFKMTIDLSIFRPDFKEFFNVVGVTNKFNKIKYNVLILLIQYCWIKNNIFFLEYIKDLVEEFR
jgi:hypothetical protein